MELHLPPKPQPVVGPGEFQFAAVGLEHGHIYGMTNGLLEAGGTLRHRELLAPFGLDASAPDDAQLALEL